MADVDSDKEEENRRLRRTMRDLVALSTLPAVWLGLEPRGIARSLAEVLLSTMSLDLVYIRMGTGSGEAEIEVFRSRPQEAGPSVEAVRASVEPVLKAQRAEPPATIPDPMGTGALHVAVTRFGFGDENGVVVSGSRRTGFPTEQERLLLGVGVNQTAIVLHRRHAEEALRENRVRLELAMEAADLGHWELNLANHTAIRNLRHDRIFGYDSLLPEWTYEKLLAHVVGEERDAVDASFKQAVSLDRPWDFECRIRTQDGSVRWIWVKGRIFPGEHDRARRMVGTVADVTDRRQIEEELRDARVRLEAALKAGAIVTWTWDIPNNRLFADESLARLFGLSPSEARGGLLAKYIESIHPDDRSRVMAALASSLETGADYESEYRVLQQDGSLRWVVARGRAERDHTGKPTRMPGVIVDLTERKLLEEELRRRAEQLAEADRGKEQLLASLRETDRRKDEFLATLAHELRNPLAPIRNALQILRMPRVDTKVAQQSTDVIDRQVHHLVRLVDDLLDVARLMQGKIELRRESLELATVIARAVETAQPVIDRQRQELTISLPADSLLVDADAIRLSQVICNLLTNAAKYSDPGGRISVSAGRQGTRVALRVRDTGIGIAPDMLRQVFEPFVQADHATTRSQGGLGIGLTLVKSLVELHGGTVRAHSAGLGEGSDFVVDLPLLVDSEQRPHQEKERHQVTLPTGQRVLVVDDNVDGAATLATVLEMQGHEVRVANDGLAALDIMQAFRPALVLLDIGMPGLDGYEVARRIRRLPNVQETVLVALTGWGQPEDRRRTAEAGFDHHLVKPFEIAVLEQLLVQLGRGAVGSFELTS